VPPEGNVKFVSPERWRLLLGRVAALDWGSSDQGMLACDLPSDTSLD